MRFEIVLGFMGGCVFTLSVMAMIIWFRSRQLRKRIYESLEEKVR